MRKAFNIIFGIFCASAGVLFLKHAMIASGGTAGIALSASYLAGTSFSVMFFLINLPFYIFSYIHLGPRFTINSVLSVSLLSLMTSIDQYLPSFVLPMWTGAVAGGLLIGFGLSVMFKNGSSLGGFNIMTLYLQKRFGFNPGKTNFVFDFIAVMSSFYAVGLIGGLYSILTITIISKVISYYKNDFAKKSTSESKNKPAGFKKAIRTRTISAT